MQRRHTRKTSARNLHCPAAHPASRYTYAIGYNPPFPPFSIAGRQRNKDIPCDVPVHYREHTARSDRKYPEKPHHPNLHLQGTGCPTLKQMLPYFRTKISSLRHREVPTKYIASRFLHSKHRYGE